MEKDDPVVLEEAACFFKVLKNSVFFFEGWLLPFGTCFAMDKCKAGGNKGTATNRETSKGKEMVMAIEGSKNLGNWGHMTPVNDSGSIHITQTNGNAAVGPGAHVTTQVNGESFRDYFDNNGNYKGSDF